MDRETILLQDQKQSLLRQARTLCDNPNATKADLKKADTLIAEAASLRTTSTLRTLASEKLFEITGKRPQFFEKSQEQRGHAKNVVVSRDGPGLTDKAQAKNNREECEPFDKRQSPRRDCSNRVIEHRSTKIDFFIIDLLCVTHSLVQDSVTQRVSTVLRMTMDTPHPDKFFSVSGFLPLAHSLLVPSTRSPDACRFEGQADCLRPPRPGGAPLSGANIPEPV
jgi:hypothetical protein